MSLKIERLNIPPSPVAVEPTQEELNSEFVDVRNTGAQAIDLGRLLLSRGGNDPRPTPMEDILRLPPGQLHPGMVLRVHTGSSSVTLTVEQSADQELSHVYCGRSGFVWNHPGPGLVRVHVQPNWEEDEVRYETPAHEWASLRRGAGLTPHRPPF